MRLWDVMSRAGWVKWGIGVAMLVMSDASAAVRYVNISSPTPVSPYTSWATAARTIQEAVDVAVPGELVLVTNGVYATGGRLGLGALTNRVVVDKALTLQSVNGPSVTIIQGYKIPGQTNGASAVRCVHLADGVSLIGFTLSNGATRTDGQWNIDQSGGGAWCASTNVALSNCVLLANAAFSSGGGILRGRLENCVLQNNVSLDAGGGAYGSILTGCVLEGNRADYGGGSFVSFEPIVLNRCIFRSNRAYYEGGGAYAGVLDHCSLSNNIASGDPFGAYGGGVSQATAYNCLVTGNVGDYGAGVAYCDIYNSAIFGNAATIDGGGVLYCNGYNCTITGNSAAHIGGGSSGSGLQNCIVFYNTAPGGANHIDLACSHCDPISFTCTTPLPTGTGNITAEPQLADAFHLSSTSPCRGAGLMASATGLDFDDEPWAGTPSMGCDEYQAAAISGPLTVGIVASHTNVGTDFTVSFAARTSGHAGASRWDFGDLTVVSNRPYALHSWSAAGAYKVILTAFNQSGAISATVNVSVVDAPIHYVNPANASPLAPFGSWATAAANIQDAIDAATIPGALVLVTNGIYQTGGRVVFGSMTNRVAVTKPLTVRSVNGPTVTIIRGANINGNSAIRCVYLTNGAALEGFSLTNGRTRLAGNETFEQRGGAVWCEPLGASISNCVLSGNSAAQGGASYGGAFKNCTLSGNSSVSDSGAAEASTFDNCTITGNYAGGYGAGANWCTLNDCVVQSNTTPSWGGGVANSVLNNCLLKGNSSAGSGGGAYSSALQRCLITGNLSESGGGASFCSVGNCLVTNNTAGRGGGIAYGALKNSTMAANVATNTGGGVYATVMDNSIVYYNTSPGVADYDPDCAGCYQVTYSCNSTALPGVGNFTNAPLFVNVAAGNYRLQSNSPCINAGRNLSAATGLDFYGNARIAGGTVDIGAHELPTPGSIISYLWLLQYGLPNDGSADNLDPDGDGMANWQEWRAGTNPTNSLSALRLLALAKSGPGWIITWQSVTNRTYFIERASSLGMQPGFLLLQGNIPGVAATTTFTDTNAPNQATSFYRVGVQD